MASGYRGNGVAVIALSSFLVLLGYCLRVQRDRQEAEFQSGSKPATVDEVMRHLTPGHSSPQAQRAIIEAFLKRARETEDVPPISPTTAPSAKR